VSGGEDYDDANPSNTSPSFYPVPHAGNMPTELEQSVSATLLKLAAGSPSKLFSGLTNFFGDRGVSAAVNQQQQLQAMTTPEEGTMKPAAAGSTKKSQNSLLDDYEESPMEARLRTVQYA
jgi:hypothetical protein